MGEIPGMGYGASDYAYSFIMENLSEIDLPFGSDWLQLMGTVIDLTTIGVELRSKGIGTVQL